jgi:hypothetical protein
MIDSTKDTVIMTSGISAQLYLWLDKANLILSVCVGIVTLAYSTIRLYDYLKNRRKKHV